MRTWLYPEQGDGGDPITRRVTEADIIRDYYPWWKAQMERAGKSHLISEANCIEDFIVVHWAWEEAGDLNHAAVE